MHGHHPEISFGFDYVGGQHPCPERIKSQAKKQVDKGLECVISRTKLCNPLVPKSFCAIEENNTEFGAFSCTIVA
jgi:hypothetical protein